MTMDNFGRPPSCTNLLSVDLTIESHHAPAENCVDKRKKKIKGTMGPMVLPAVQKHRNKLNVLPKVSSDPTVSYHHAAEQQEMRGAHLPKFSTVDPTVPPPVGVHNSAVLLRKKSTDHD